MEPDVEIPDDGLIERERIRAAMKLAKLQTKEKEKEDKKIAREQKREECKEIEKH